MARCWWRVASHSSNSACTDDSRYVAVVLDEQAGVGVGRDDDVRGVALVDAFHGIGHGPPAVASRCRLVTVFRDGPCAMTLLQTAWGSATARCGRRPRSSRRHRPSRSTTGTGRRRPGRRTGLDRDDVVAAALDLVVRDGPGGARPCDAWPPSSTWGRRPSTGTSAAATSSSPTIVRAQSERLAERPVDGRHARRAGALAPPANIYAGAIEHRAITSLAHQTGTIVAARCTTSKPRSSPSSRPPGSSARRAPTRCGRSSWSSPAPWSWRCATRPGPRAYRPDALWAG